MKTKNILRIGLSSPGDVAKEREVMETVLDELNHGIANERNLRLELIRWETKAFPGFHVEGPQGLIDPILDIQNCDILLGIFWKRFGTPTKNVLSGTEHELRTAVESWQNSGRPQIMIYFKHVDPDLLTQEEHEQYSHVLEFKEKFPKQGIYWSFQNERDFEGLTRKHLTQYILQHIDPLTQPDNLGTSKEISTQPPSKISLARLPSTGPALFGRENELLMLDKAWDNPHTNIVSLVAWGGVGKSALVNVWLNQMSRENCRGARRVYGYSFYDQGVSEGKQVSADLFLATALKWFGDPNPDEGSPWAKGERLAELVREQRNLLILDGLEPLQHPPGDSEGYLKDVGMQSLLRELARHNPGLCIIATRFAVGDLEEFVGNSVERIHLEQLAPEAAMAYLEYLGVKGNTQELYNAVVEFEGHALALTLMANYLKIVYKGDILQRSKISQLFQEKKQGMHARRVMASYEDWFKEKPELQILKILGLFDRPVESGVIGAVVTNPAIPGLTTGLQQLSHEDWQYAIASLRNTGLIAPESSDYSESLDCHPLVRQYFNEKLQENSPAAWQEAHRRLFEYYQEAAEEFPKTIEGMAPLFAAVTHGCFAGQHKRALREVYQARILQDKSYSWFQLGTFVSDLTAISGFFEEPWKQLVPGFDPESQWFLFHETAFYLRSLGRLKEVATPLHAALEIARERKYWELAALSAYDFVGLYLLLGKLPEALKYANESVEYADLDGELYNRMARRSIQAHILHQLGRTQEAHDLFIEAEGIQKQRPGGDILFTMNGYWFCDLLLDRMEYEEVLARLVQTFEGHDDWWYGLNDIALEYLARGQALALQSRDNHENGMEIALQELNKAIDILRKSGRRDYLPIGLLARTESLRWNGNFSEALRDLDEVYEIATGCEMNFYKAAYHLEKSKIYLKMKQFEKAQQNFSYARKMIIDMGYERRLPELHLLEAQLNIETGKGSEAGKSIEMAKDFFNRMNIQRWNIELRETERQLNEKYSEN